MCICCDVLDGYEKVYRSKIERYFVIKSEVIVGAVSSLSLLSACASASARRDGNADTAVQPLQQQFANADQQAKDQGHAG